jgi:hypothetical protein
MATIPVYLTDDDGNEIEQTAGSGDFIIIGYVDQDLFANASGELYTTFFDVVQAGTPEQKAEVLRGLRLAKGIRGDLRRFELSGTSDNAYVKYNHSIFGGRYQSQYTALGAIAGTYLRRGGSSFTKELVEAALVSGPFASFSDFPSSPVLPGDVTFQVNAGGGTVEGYAWTITDGTTTFSPTVASPTVTLTEGTWTVSVDVTIDGAAVPVAGQTLEVSALAVAAGLTNSNPTPNLGESTLLGLVIDDTDLPLLQDIEWSFNVELAAGQRVELTEDVDYTVNAESGKTIDVTFLTAGTFEVSATVTDTSGTVVSTQTNLDVADYATTNTVASDHILSQATADALVQGDTHVIVLGDSLNLPLRADRWRSGMANSFAPARWAGIQPADSNFGENAGQTFSQNDEHDAHRHFSTGFTINRGQGGHANLEVDGTKSGVTYADSRLAARRTMGGVYLEMDALNTSPTLGYNVTARSGSFADILRGRLQSPADTFYRASSVNSRSLFYNLDDTITLTGTAVDSTSDHSFTMDSEGYYLMEVERDATTGTDSISAALDVSFDSIAASDVFGWMDSFVYSPSTSGLSISYLGDGGWNTSNHTSDAARVAANANQSNQYYSDDACAAHLDMVAWKDKSQTTLRDNVVFFFAIQNGSQDGAGHDGQMREDLLAVKTRWEAAADVVDPSGTLKAKLKFVIVSMPDIVNGNQHDRTAAMLPDIVGLGGYSNVEFIDLHNAIKSAEGGIYADPADYTAVTAGGNGTISPIWYDGTDAVHPVRAGSDKQMEILWSVIQDAAADPTGFSFTINAPSNGTDQDTYNYTLSGSLPTDRLVTWYVDDVEIAYGDAFTLPAVVGTFVVKATVNGLDGASTTVTAPAVTITEANVPPVVTSPLALQSGADTTEGQAFNIVVTATDGNGDDLTYSLSSTEGDFGSITRASGVEAVIPTVAGTAGVTATYTVTITDGNGGSVVETLDVTFLSSNALPAFSSGLTLNDGNPTVGDTFQMNFTVFDSDPGDTLTVTLTSTAGDNTSKVVTSGVSNFFRPTAQSGTVTYTATVDDGNGGTDVSTLDVTADPANTAPTSSSSVSVANATETGDTATIILTNITDDSTAIGSLTYAAQFSVDGGAFSNISGVETGNVIDAAGNGIVNVSHLCSVAGDYVFRIAITDGDGATTNFDSATTTISVPAGPTLLESQTFNVYETSGTFANYYTGGVDAGLNTAVGFAAEAEALSRVQFSGNTSVGTQWACGSSANAVAFANWINNNVTLIRMTDADGDVLEYDVTTAFAGTSSSFMRLTGAAYSLNGSATGAYTFAMRTAMISAPDLVIEYFG